jgi:hypothetical protein
VLATLPLAFSGHAAARCAQRAIPPHAIDILLAYGSCARSRGADSYFLDKDGRRRVRKDLGERGYREIERWLDAYAVVGSDGSVITAAWRSRRLRRH